MAPSASFDPYHKWLGIPPREQPPNHYRLLGLGLFEDDRDVIDMVAGRQIEHVRSLALGEHADEAQKLLNELAAARVCLLNADKKTAYDARLRAPAQPVAAPAAAAVVPAATVPPVTTPVPESRPVAPWPNDLGLDGLRVSQHASTHWQAQRAGPARLVVALATLAAIAGAWWIYHWPPAPTTTQPQGFADSAAEIKLEHARSAPGAPSTPAIAADAARQKTSKGQPSKQSAATRNRTPIEARPALGSQSMSTMISGSPPLEISVDTPAVDAASLPGAPKIAGTGGAGAGETRAGSRMAIDEFSWTGAKRVRMDKSAFAFCGFSRISGALEGYDERALIGLAQDGFFHLGGISGQPSFAVRAVAVRMAERNQFKLPDREYVWQPGRPPLKLIQEEEGFCVLSAISGQFGGEGDLVHVYLDDEGDWCLGGTSTNPVSAAALVFAHRQHAMPPVVKEYRWQAGMAPVRMISRTAGFCLLSGIGGAFEGDGEAVEVRIADDGYWYLTGRSSQPSLVAEAISVSF